MKKKVAIIGSGIVGATAAFYLSQEDSIDLTIYDFGHGQATKAAAGIISPWLSQRRNKDWYFLAKEGAKFYNTLIADIEKYHSTHSFYKKTGTILYKKSPELLKKLEKLAYDRREEAPEIGEIKLLESEEIIKLIPIVTSKKSALYISGGAKIDGTRLINTLQNITKQTSRFISKKVTNISYNDNQWTVTDSNAINSFDELILATGAWLPDLLTPLNFNVDIRPQKGQLISIQTNLNTNNWPVIMPVGESDIIPFEDGKILIGATHENDEGYDLTPSPILLEQLKEHASLTAQSIDDYDIDNYRVGTRAYTSDFLPFFGELKELPHLLVASGLGSSGLTTGPIIGKTLADWTMNHSTLFESYKNSSDTYIVKKDDL